MGSLAPPHYTTAAGSAGKRAPAGPVGTTGLDRVVLNRETFPDISQNRGLGALGLYSDLRSEDSATGCRFDPTFKVC